MSRTNSSALGVWKSRGKMSREGEDCGSRREAEFHLGGYIYELLQWSGSGKRRG